MTSSQKQEVEQFTTVVGGGTFSVELVISDIYWN